MLKVIQSSDPAVDTFKCPKCGALWRAEGHYNFDEGGWAYELNEDLCPRNCTNFFGFRVTGKIQ